MVQETTEYLEKISGIAADPLSRIEAKLKMPGKIAGHLKKQMVSQVAALQQTLVSELANVKDAIRGLFTSKYSSSYGGDGYAALQEHFDEIWGAFSALGMLEVTTKAYSKGLITHEVKETIFSVHDTSEGRKANFLLSAIQKRIKTDQNAFDTFVEVLRSMPPYGHLADKLVS